ncbi:Rrf2 family transcriptional regulator [Aliiroseovarius sp. KMU-50]|uniref:Rrf2 family transcriptional regulator n=1 Tax=Aliiroseovarius salicola TaxID=3009082 RepID=A0ABT4VXV7_9RHOB|nr:Rrf2 family transcriptional regulator [Aliiroseovarius sp. KMU-50]MDA5092560.1 Rrf2 family transcriptional regulator [Aliiroseovarius sp. KMU-50]
MNILNSQLIIASHILAVLAHHRDDGAITSDMLAEGFGTNPVVIRRVLSQLKKAGLIESRPGAGGGSILARPPEKISLRDAYGAVDDGSGGFLFRPRGQCREGVDIAPIIGEYLNELAVDAKETLLQSLEKVSIADLTSEIGNRIRLISTAASTTTK